MNKFFKKGNGLRKFNFSKMLLLIMVVFTTQAFAQEQAIKGNVTAASDSMPLAGVNVLVAGTSAGTQTDFDGNYTIKAKKGDVLNFSYVGMETKSVTVGDSATVNVVLANGGNVLDEIVIVGYGSQSRAKVTGAISTINSEDLISAPTTSAEQALQGRASGVTLINGGSPGTAPTVRIRGVGTYGSNEPIFVVDGVVTNNISNLSSDDIESISVLKDASTTAVYGALGANGVIVVKTKSGKAGKVKFNFSSYFGNQTAPESLEVLNSDQYVSYITDLKTNAGDPAPSRFSDANFAQMVANNNTNWQDEVFQSGIMNAYNLSAAGGSEKATFRISGGYLNQDGIILNTNMERYTLRANSEFKSGRFSFGENLSIAFSKQNPLIGANSLSPLETAFRSVPYLSVHTADGGYNGVVVAADENKVRNAVRSLNEEVVVNRATSILGNVYAGYEVMKGLDYKVNLGISHGNMRNKNVKLPYSEANGAGETKDDTTTAIYNARVNDITLNNSLNYKTTLAEKHNIDVLLLAEKQERTYFDTNISGSTNLGNEEINNGVSYSRTIPYNKVGYLGRINYDFDGKYLLAVSLRRDGSSRFGANNRWGTFPSVAGGWIISNEDFYSTDAIMNFVKLRGSWGKAGNDASAGDFAFSSSLSTNFGSHLGAGVVFASPGNPDLKWEETTMFTFGTDFGFLNNQLTASIEYYENTSDDLIVQAPPAGSNGITGLIYQNVGAMETYGFEFNLGYRKKEGDFKWSTNFNLSTSNNEVTGMSPNVTEIFAGNNANILAGGTISRLAEGESMWHFYGYETDGIFQSAAEVTAHATQTDAEAGDIRFKDLNGDGVIDADDRTVIGNPLPTLNYGLSFNADYKNFDLGLLFSGVSGNEIFNATRYYLDGNGEVNNAGPAVLNSWTPTNASTTQPRAIFGDPNKNTRVSDRYVEDGAYVKLKTLSLGYSIDNDMLKQIAKGAFSKFRIYVSGQNLFTMTDYSGYDPELTPFTGAALDSNSGVNTEVGVDRGQYPQPKSILAGIQLSF